MALLQENVSQACVKPIFNHCPINLPFNHTPKFGTVAMIRSTFLSITIFVIVMGNLSSMLVADTRIFIVRHAEKQSQPAADPSLSPLGQERAKQLANVLRSVTFAKCYASHFKRTQETIGPIAKANRIDLILYEAANSEELAARIRKEDRGANVLVAGHTNTIPTLLKQFDINIEEIPETQYDNLFVVILDDQDHAELIHLHYGASL
jgi:2,3-bisphosphoglycerate-dependent phosphoglycerate mutase